MVPLLATLLLVRLQWLGWDEVAGGGLISMREETVVVALEKGGT